MQILKLISMQNYRRYRGFLAGRTFFTVNLLDQRRGLLERQIVDLREVERATKRERSFHN
ncbi:hypothetical protein [Nitrosomonas ureae]|uniref:Uncharacterized protein n=1 Tax=Nitrosomonas ureae TaxID=44577 RepID=A0A1H2GP50_9PROT|nr:hypothetical protein [Nitrosomonas ureae]ALQ51131.1 hypothetical protein ATY38_07780 [Nitrosomonas ureae]SDU21476.1 hypothetical protein SAMN05216406_13511 [Nitrosomonas ureae]